MIATFDKDALFGFIKDLYTVIGIRISIFDDVINMVTEYPVNAPEICELIRTTEAGRTACTECDKAACERAKRTHSAHIYKCHAGITEAISPIQVDGAIVGYAIFAHLMPEDNYDESIKDICEKCIALGLDEGEVAIAVKKLKTHKSDKIAASIRLLDAIASYLQTKKLASLKNEDLSAQLKTYIDVNLNKDLSSDVLCRNFFISRTKLYQLSLAAFGCSISKYILTRRVEKAKDLLATGKYSVSGVARTVGIDDYNYFCKLFKKQTGVPPSKYLPRDS